MIPTVLHYLTEHFYKVLQGDFNFSRPYKGLYCKQNIFPDQINLGYFICQLTVVSWICSYQICFEIHIEAKLYILANLVRNVQRMRQQRFIQAVWHNRYEASRSHPAEFLRVEISKKVQYHQAGRQELHISSIWCHLDASSSFELINMCTPVLTVFPCGYHLFVFYHVKNTQLKSASDSHSTGL